MKFTLITLFPEMLQTLQYGVIGRAIDNNIISINAINPRKFTQDTHKTVDDRPYGGGPGMVMQYEPLVASIKAAKSHSHATCPVIYLSPQGKPLTQDHVNELAQLPEIILLAGRYEGIDQRVIDQHVDAELSVGDYVVSGGELPAMLLVDAVTRMLPNTLGDDQSNQQDSFIQPYFDHPHYTRPECIDGYRVPEVLLSGDHKAIANWRLKESLGKTWQKRKDLLKRRTLTRIEQDALQQAQQELE
jgi:tRNA (guanine37-N1)-methyltransferase